MNKRVAVMTGAGAIAMTALLFGTMAHAQTGYAVTLSAQNISAATSTTQAPVQGVGTGISGTLTSIEEKKWYQASGSGNSGVLFEIRSCIDSAYTTCTLVGTTTRTTYTVPVGYSENDFIIQLSHSVSLDPTLYYKISVDETFTYTGSTGNTGAAVSPVYQPPTIDGRQIVSSAGGLVSIYYYLIGEYSPNGISIGAATSSSIFSGQDATSTLTDLAAQCSQSGNIFAESICIAFSFLFLPSNASVAQIAGIPAAAGQRFPFSYIAGVTSAFGSLTASTTPNFAPVELNFRDNTPIATSTPGFGNFMPDLMVLSTTTLFKYISPTLWGFLQGLIAVSLWFTLAFDIFFSVRNQMTRV
jgi:hypothetical protein